MDLHCHFVQVLTCKALTANSDFLPGAFKQHSKPAQSEFLAQRVPLLHAIDCMLPRTESSAIAVVPQG